MKSTDDGKSVEFEFKGDAGDGKVFEELMNPSLYG